MQKRDKLPRLQSPYQLLYLPPGLKDLAMVTKTSEMVLLDAGVNTTGLILLPTTTGLPGNGSLLLELTSNLESVTNPTSQFTHQFTSMMQLEPLGKDGASKSH